jgi:excisionase family DNA binding protein
MQPANRPLTRTDVMRAGEVAEHLGVPNSTVEDRARRGLLPSRKRGKRRFYFRWEVQAWLTAEDAA